MEDISWRLHDVPLGRKPAPITTFRVHWNISFFSDDNYKPTADLGEAEYINEHEGKLTY